MSAANYVDGIRTFNMVVRPIGNDQFILDGPFGMVDNGSKEWIDSVLSEIVPESLETIYPTLGKRTNYIVTWMLR